MNAPTRIALLCTFASACVLAPQSGIDTLSSSSTSTGSPGQSETGLALPESTSTSPTSTGGSTSTSTTSSTADADDHGGFIITPDGGDATQTCDPYAQDCAPGEKCTWWADHGSLSWNATKCVPIADDPAQLGEPCLAEGGGVSGDDDCDLGMMCWDLDQTGHGTCISFCLGSEREPSCPRGYGCTGGRDGFALCIKNCDPLAQDCPGDDLCLPVDNTYLCVLDASGDEGQLHDPCDYTNACDPGLVCINPASSPQCDQNASGCCLPLCAIDDPDCPDAGQSCLPVFVPQPPDYPNIGYCSVSE